MSGHIVKYYPVGNGDTILIKLESNVTIINDCKIRTVEEGIYDVKADLLKELQDKKRDGHHFTDLFILSHHDLDHCSGFEKHFYCGETSNFSPDDKDKIIIDELWVNSFILSDTISKDSSAWYVKKEVERRIDLYKNNHPSRSERGNRLRLIGSDPDENFVNVPQYYPGQEYVEINGEVLDDFGIFIHSPLKQNIIEGNAQSDRNATSIAYQARFRNNLGSLIGRFIHSGDSDHYRWVKIKEKSEEKHNEDALYWDVFLAPHHCSWTFFNNTPYKDNSKPKDSSLEILEYANNGAWVVTSSKEILDNDDTPPHYPAKTEYSNKVNTGKFLSTQEFYSKKKKPIIFRINNNGISLPSFIPPIGISTGSEKPSRAGSSNE